MNFQLSHLSVSLAPGQDEGAQMVGPPRRFWRLLLGLAGIATWPGAAAIGAETHAYWFCGKLRLERQARRDEMRKRRGQCASRI